MHKTASLLASAALFLTVGSAAYGQTTIFGTNFDGSTTYPYNDATAYSTTPDFVGQGGWTGNDDPSVDEGAGTTYHGGLNQIVTTAGFSTGLGGQLEGQIVSGGVTVVPGAASVYVAHPITLSTGAKNGTVSLDSDFDITTSANAFNSSYGFTLLNSANANVLSIQFVRDPANVNTRDLVEYQIGNGTMVNNNNAINLNGVYHLKVTVNMRDNTFSASYTGNGTTLNVFTNVGLGSTLATSSTQAGVTEFGNTNPDGNGGYTGSGQDTFTFDNFALTVPEPSTYAMLALGGLGLAALLRSRARRA